VFFRGCHPPASCVKHCGITMAICAASSTRLVVSTSCRVRKTRTLASPQLTSFSGSSPSQVKCHSFDSHCASASSKSISSTFSHNLAVRSSFAPLSATALAADFCEAQDQEKLSYRQLDLSSVVLAFSLGFVAASTSPCSDHGSSGSGAKFSRKGGGGGGPLKPPASSVFGARKRAEEDVRKIEEEAVQNPYTVSSTRLGQQ
jgi:hypothetical protein